jgi:pyridoxal phosphate enzyme (YggS family)
MHHNNSLRRILDITNEYNTSLVAVSKTKPIEAIMELYQEGHKIFGENKVQELCMKYENLPKDIEWHLIGHLQTNKVKQIIPFVHLIHSVDSEKLLNEIEKQARKANRKISCLLQFYIAQEETKQGFDLSEVEIILKKQKEAPFEFIEFRGVMGMASFTEDQDQIRNEFRGLKQIFDYLKSTYFISNPLFNEISMGMSSDFELALEEGSTMIRVGSLLFGSR